jgi:hypothetical protein
MLIAIYPKIKKRQNYDIANYSEKGVCNNKIGNS